MSGDNEIFPRSSIIQGFFETALPCDATKEQIMEWVAHNLGVGGISLDNPLSKHEMEALNEPILTDTRLYLHQKAERSNKGWTIHSWKENTPFTGPDPMDVVYGGKQAINVDADLEDE